MNKSKNKRHLPVIVPIVLMPVTIVLWFIGWLLITCISDSEDSASQKKQK